MKYQALTFLCLLGLAVWAGGHGRWFAPIPPVGVVGPFQGEASPAEEQAMTAALQQNVARLRSAGRVAAPQSAPTLTYVFPLRMAPGRPDYAGYRVSAFVDHNPAGGAVLDYNGGARTYDGHRGTDYGLYPFAWNKLDAGDVQVVAAAAGTIINKVDDNPADHNCNGSSGGSWNYIALLHADGRLTIYGHLRHNSFTAKGVGAAVAQGEYLATAASSGDSSGPHLHFEVRVGSFSTNEWVDPYAGPSSQPESLWAGQRPYYDSAINRLATHSAPPVENPCLPTTTNLQDSFTAPATIYFYAYYRDYQGGLPTQFTVYRPDGSVFQTWQDTPANPAFQATAVRSAAFAFSTLDPGGAWRFEAVYNGQTYETHFTLSGPVLAAHDDFVLTPLNTAVTIDVLSNDSRPDDATLTALGAPANGTASLVNGQVGYTPTVGFLGQDVFTYTVSANTDQSTATVTVLVAAEVSHLYLPVIRR